MMALQLVCSPHLQPGPMKGLAAGAVVAALTEANGSIEGVVLISSDNMGMLFFDSVETGGNDRWSPNN